MSDDEAWLPVAFEEEGSSPEESHLSAQNQNPEDELIVLPHLTFEEPNVDVLYDEEGKNREVLITAPAPPETKLHIRSSKEEFMHDDLSRMNHVLSAVSAIWQAPLSINDTLKVGLSTMAILEKRRKLVQSYDNRRAADPEEPIDITPGYMNPV